MSSLALEIDQTMQQLNAVTASRLESLVSDALALVKSSTVNDVKSQSIRFPLVHGAKTITSEDVARLRDEVLFPDSPGAGSLMATFSRHS